MDREVGTQKEEKKEEKKNIIFYSPRSRVIHGDDFLLSSIHVGSSTHSLQRWFGASGAHGGGLGISTLLLGVLLGIILGQRRVWSSLLVLLGRLWQWSSQRPQPQVAPQPNPTGPSGGRGRRVWNDVDITVVDDVWIRLVLEYREHTLRAPAVEFQQRRYGQTGAKLGRHQWAKAHRETTAEPKRRPTTKQVWTPKNPAVSKAAAIRRGR
jgi:hypothetical protein